MCRLDVGGGSDDSKTKGNQTIAGQIATFMEGLHLSYSEVWEVIPYRQLLLMSTDKLSIDYSEKEEVEVISGREMLKRQRNGKT